MAEIIGRRAKEYADQEGAPQRDMYFKHVLAKGEQMIAEVESDKNPDKRYKVIRTVEGYIYCSCASWVFNRKPPSERFCKHTEKIRASLGDKLLKTGDTNQIERKLQNIQKEIDAQELERREAQALHDIEVDIAHKMRCNQENQFLTSSKTWRRK